MIIYIYGEDNLRSREYLRESKEQFKKQRDPGGYNIVTVDGKKTTASKIFAEINTAPFLGEKRMVIVENILSSSDKDLLGEVAEKISEKKVPESTVLIFWQGEGHSKVKETKMLHDILIKEKFSKNHERLTGDRLMDWIVREVKLKGGEIDRNAAAKLSEEGDVWSIKNKINQLTAFTNGKVISVKEVVEFSEEKLDDNIFNLTDAVVSGNHKKALTLLEGQRKLGEEDGKIFGTILWQFRIIIEMSDLIDREGGLTSDQIAKKLSIHPFVAKKNLALVRQYSLARLESIYSLLLETDLKTKTGRGSQSLLLDLFVAKV